jgi:hypothetical protein
MGVPSKCGVSPSLTQVELAACIAPSGQVQDWITLCITSGGMERHRWQEQGVLAFVWLLFTDTDQLLFLPKSKLDWLHTRKMDRVQPVCGELVSD